MDKKLITSFQSFPDLSLCDLKATGVKSLQQSLRSVLKNSSSMIKFYSSFPSLSFSFTSCPRAHYISHLEVSSCSHSCFLNRLSEINTIFFIQSYVASFNTVNLFVYSAAVFYSYTRSVYSSQPDERRVYESFCGVVLLDIEQNRVLLLDVYLCWYTTA